MRIATWNINGIKARLEVLLRWLSEEKPDIVVLQEIKTVDEGFPRAEIEALGELVRARVNERAGIGLEWEIVRIGRAAALELAA